jgi:hypothetical protein
MEIAVIQDDSAQLCASLPADHEVVVEDQSELRVSLQVALHLYDSVDGGVDDVSIGVKEDSQLLKYVNEDLILHVLLIRDLRHRPLYSCGRDGVGGEYGWSEVAAGRLLLLDENGLVHNELLDDLSSHHLRMSIVDDLVYYLVDQYKVLPDALLIQHSAIVSEHLHHPVQYVHHERGRDVVLGSCDEEYAELLSVKEIDSLHILQIYANEHPLTLQTLGVGHPART